MLNSNWYKIVLRAMKIQYGKKLTLNGIPIIYNKRGAHLSIGRHVTIKSSFLSNLIGLYQRTIIVTRLPDAEIIIGDFVGLSGVTIYARKSIHIGDHTIIGANTKILDNDFHPLDADARNRDDKSAISSRAVRIGHDCFIGCNALILKGTILGAGCVVGAGAVVSGIFRDNSVIVGNPGKAINKVQGENGNG